MRRYWIVSPNVGKSTEADVRRWKAASLNGHAAFMGWDPNHDDTGKKFAYEISPGDRILIARSKKFKPEVVGAGIVQGDFVPGHKKFKGMTLPHRPGSIRMLK